MSGELGGPANTASHVLATDADLGHPREMVRLTEELTSSDAELTPARIGNVRINIARSQLDLGDQEGAQTSLVQAWDIVPQMVKVHSLRFVGSLVSADDTKRCLDRRN